MDLQVRHEEAAATAKADDDFNQATRRIEKGDAS